MIRGSVLRRVVNLLVVAGLPLASSHAGIFGAEIAVTNRSNVLIADGTNVTSLAAGTNYGYVGVAAGESLGLFTIHNLNGNVDLVLNSINISGTHAAEFAKVINPEGVIETSSTLGISFNPAGAGVRTALVTISNSDSDEGTYTFAISGIGGGLPLAAPQLKLEFAAPVKGKINFKTNTAKLGSKLNISNLGPVAMEAGTVQVYFSRDHILDPQDALLSEIALKPLAELNPDKPKVKKVKLKSVQGPDAENGGFVFVRALPLPLSVQDLDWSNNVASQHYIVSNPVGP